jgi:hypothetical protein
MSGAVAWTGAPVPLLPEAVNMDGHMLFCPVNFVVYMLL